MAWPSPGGPMETFSPMSELCSALDVWDEGGRGPGPRGRESQRLAIDALVEQGPAAYRDFLRQEGLPAFLSEPEVEHIVLHHQRPALHSHSGAAASSALSLTAGPHGNGGNYEMAMVLAGGGGGGAGGEEDDDMGSGTYWPVFSDVTVPELELGWPNAPRSLGTSVSCYFQPPLEDGDPSIKEVVRKLIRSANKVVAVAMDVFSDVDLFSELVEVSGPTRRVPVYLVLDAIAFPLFWDMCSGMQLRPRDLQNMRIRMLNGTSYCCKSGVKIRGQSLERTLLVDAHTVLSGSYGFSWSFEKLHRSVVHVFEGEAVRVFDDRFRVLYAHSQPVDVARLLQPRPRGPDRPALKLAGGGRFGPALNWVDPWQRQQGQQGQQGPPGLLPGGGSFGSSGGLSLGPGDRLRYTRQQNSHQQQQQEADTWALGASGWPAGAGRGTGPFDGETLTLHHHHHQQQQQRMFARQVVVEDSAVGWRRGEAARGGGAAAIAYSRQQHQQQQLVRVESGVAAQGDESTRRRRLFRAELAHSREESRVLEARFALGDGGGLRDFVALQLQQQQQQQLHAPLGLDWGQQRGPGKPWDERRWNAGEEEEAADAPGPSRGPLAPRDEGAALMRDLRGLRGLRGAHGEPEGPERRRTRALPWDGPERTPDLPEPARGLLSRWSSELKVGPAAEAAGQRLPGDGMADSPYWKSCRKPHDAAAAANGGSGREKDAPGREAAGAGPAAPDKGSQPASAALLSRSKMSPLLQQNSRLRSSLIYTNAAAGRGPAPGDGDAGGDAGVAGAAAAARRDGPGEAREGVNGASKAGVGDRRPGVAGEPRRLGVGEPGGDARRGAVEESRREGGGAGEPPASSPLRQASGEPGRAPGADARAGEERAGRGPTRADPPPTRGLGLVPPALEISTARALQRARDPSPCEPAPRNPPPRDPPPREPSQRELSQKEPAVPAVPETVRPKAAPTGSVFYRSLYLKPGSPVEAAPPQAPAPLLPALPARSPTGPPLAKLLAPVPSPPWVVSPTSPALAGSAGAELKARNGVGGAAVAGANVASTSAVQSGVVAAAAAGSGPPAAGIRAPVAPPSPAASDGAPGDGSPERNSGQLVRKLESMRKEGRAFSCFEALLRPGADELQRQQEEEERRKLDEQKRQEELREQREQEESRQKAAAAAAVAASDAGAAVAVGRRGSDVPYQRGPSSLRPLGNFTARAPVGHAYQPTTSYTWRRW